MKKLIQVEEFAMLGLSIYGLYLLDVSWWFYLILLIGPDISMLGYLAGEKIGPISYNLFHHKGVAILVFIGGLIFNSWILQALGIILFGHSSMDRIFGYGLKHFTAFTDTHLGKIGSQKKKIAK